jgi:pimeloyl-ACP methyl ester carboxylesterase
VNPTTGRGSEIILAVTAWFTYPLASCFALVLIGLVAHRVASFLESRRFPPPGELIEAGGLRLHLYAQGEGSPVVVLDSALAGTSLSWFAVQPRVAELTRVVSYDRGGFGWSGRSPAPRRVDHFVEELRRGLARAGIAPPYVLVGHSYGGWIMKLFASRHPEEVAGLVLVDVPHPREWENPNEEQLRRIARGACLSRRAAGLASFGVTRLLFRLAARGVSLGSSTPGEDRKIALLLSKVPHSLRGTIRSFWVRAATLRALGSLIENAPASARLVRAEARPLGARPLVVLTASNPSEERLRDQAEVAQLSTRSRQLVASGSSHWIPLDEPQLIVDAIHEVVIELRARGAAPLTTRRSASNGTSERSSSRSGSG